MAKTGHHRQHRVGWLRAAVLGANDGIVSTSSLIIGVASASSGHQAVLLAGMAGLIAGAISMAAGEYVSVCSQADTEKADLAQEQESLDKNYELELIELSEIYESRGVEKDLATEVARQLMKHDSLAAHARDEIGISEATQARPIQAAASSAASFTLGASLPLVVVIAGTPEYTISLVAVCSVLFLALLGAISAYLGGATILKGIIRVTFWGVLAMVVTGLVGFSFDRAV